MYGENSGNLRAELTILLRQHRIQQRIGGPGSHTVPETTTSEERKQLGEQIDRYRHAVLVWSVQAIRATDPGSPFALTRAPAAELQLRLKAAIQDSRGLPPLGELTTEQSFPLVETWRQAARAAALGEHDFSAGRLSTTQGMTVLRDVADVTRALVVLNRRYSNIPEWNALRNPGLLRRAAESCATFAERRSPDYAVDHQGWRPTAARTEGPALPGLAGVLQAERNLLAHLDTFPDAHSLRVVAASQRLVSAHAATLLDATDTEQASLWQTRATTYAQLVRATRDLGGQLGNGGPAAGQGAIAASRSQALQPTDMDDPTALRELDRLFVRVDHKISDIIEHGVAERIYFVRMRVPRIDDNAIGFLRPTRERYVPITSPVQTNIPQIVCTQLRRPAIAQTVRADAPQSRATFAAAITHHPGDRETPSLEM